MHCKQQRNHDQDATAAQRNQPFRSLVRLVQVACAHALADQHRRRVRKSGKETNDQTFQRAEHRNGRDGLLRLTAQHHIDDHVAHADEDLVAQNREAFAEVFRQDLAVPLKMLADAEQIRISLLARQQQNYNSVDGSGKHRAQCRTLHTHRRQAEFAVDQHPVEQNVGADRRNCRVKRNAHALR